MKKKKYIFIISAIIAAVLIAVVLIPKEADRLVYYNDVSFMVTDYKIEEKELDGLIGAVAKKISKYEEPRNNGESNCFEEGTELYSIRSDSSVLNDSVDDGTSEESLIKDNSENMYDDQKIAVKTKVLDNGAEKTVYLLARRYYKFS